MKETGGTRLALWAYGVGLLAITVFGSQSFWLAAYGQGGVPEYRGRLAAIDEFFPPGVDYILFNHGDVTAISPDYWQLVKRAERIGPVVCLSALPLLLAGLFAYWRHAGEAGGDFAAGWRIWRLVYYPRLTDPPITRFARSFSLMVLPRLTDPLIATFAKVFFFMDFAGMLLFNLTSLSVCSEPEFLRRVTMAKVVEAVAAALLACGIALLARITRAQRNGSGTGAGQPVRTAAPTGPG